MNNNNEKLKLLIKLASYIYFLDGLYLENLQLRKKDNELELLKLKVLQCKRCLLYKSRTNVVFGEGNEKAELMFVGEAPGYEEDKQARPFVGKAGELLTKIIQAMGLKREDVYITNVVKCHPGVVPDPNLRNNDRPPSSEEINSCFEYLKQQISIIKPKVICCLGFTATKALTKNEVPISELRGKIFEYEVKELNIKIIPTYHPAALLRNPSLKKYVWQDMKLIMKILNIKKK
ncbi:MAG: uracil-DNA glycosylase [Elusimicrobiota bacterium]|nr:uracil-DNA glycosylase [Endomicrobiia bacterium]MDW8164942.1 uracil-DNA glycosylase [Elusimicrobiota bacterium]